MQLNIGEVAGPGQVAGGVAVAVEVKTLLNTARRRPPGQIEPLIGAHEEDLHGGGGLGRRVASHGLVEEAGHYRVEVDHRVMAEVKLAQPSIGVHLVAPGTH